jgi:hypothetical protein
MKSSSYDSLHEVSPLGLEKSERNSLEKTRLTFIHFFVNFWRFSRYYGQFIAYRR